MRKVEKLSKQPEKTLILPYEEVNTGTTLDKSLSGTSVQHGAQSKATTNKKSKKKRNPPSSKPKTSKIIRESSLSTQVVDTQHAKEPITTTDATKGLDTSESVAEQGNQPKTANAKKVQENIVDEAEHFVKEKEVDDEFTDSGIRSLGNVTFEELHRNAEESPYDTKSEIKIVKRLNLHHFDDDDQIKFIGPVYSDMEDDIEAQSDGIKITLTNSSKDARHKEELSKSEEMATNNVLDELADMANSHNAEINSSTKNPSLSDPLGHIHKDLSSLTSRVEHLESSLAQEVANKFEDSMPRLVANAFEDRIIDLLSDTLKNILPQIIKDSIKQTLYKFDKKVKKILNVEIPELLIRPLNNAFNLLNKKERSRFDSLQNS
ncbi:hypothetical protein Tco_0850345, partial [Tanacetum coccineum]